jgi:hypothetical protein
MPESPLALLSQRLNKVSLCIAVWLFNIARQYNRNPWGWFVFACFLDVMALVVFYLVRMHELIEADIY